MQSIFTFLIVILSFVAYKYYVFRERIRNELVPNQPIQCNHLPIDIPGPEDFALSALHLLMFVSSHNRRQSSSVGSIFGIKLDKDIAKFDESVMMKLPIDDHPNLVSFKPHGITIFENSSFIRLYVISHPKTNSRMHTIEVFDYDFELTRLKYVQTLENNELLSSPNDLVTIGFDSLLISNDHPAGNPAQLLFDDYRKLRRATLVHYNGLDRKNSWSILNSTASFGNGVILANEKGKEFIYRASAADYSLLKYSLIRKDGGQVELHYVSETTLPLSPDNLELDHDTGGILITGHPSTYLFLLHAATGLPVAPSATVLYHADRQGSGVIETLFKDETGKQMSASSVAVRYTATGLGGEKQRPRLFIGQVFDPFVLVCV